MADWTRLSQVLLRGELVAAGVDAASEAERRDLLRLVLLADGRIDEPEARLLREAFYADGRLDAEEVAFLRALKREAAWTCPGFDALLAAATAAYAATEDAPDAAAALAGGRIDEAEAAFLRDEVFAGGAGTLGDLAFLAGLYRQAATRCPAFDDFLFQAFQDHIVLAGEVDDAVAALLADVLAHEAPPPATAFLRTVLAAEVRHPPAFAALATRHLP